MASLIEIRTEAGTLELESDAHKKFYITRQVNDLHTLDTKEADYTKTLKVPATPNNLKILDRDEAKIPCSILVEGVMIAPLASLLKIKTTNTNGVVVFEVVIFYGNFGLFDNIVPGNLSNINWADLATLWEPVEVGLLGNNLTDMAWAATDWNADTFYWATTLQVQDVNRTGFWMYTKEIVRRIVLEAGYELELVSVPPEYDILALGCPVNKFINTTSVEGVSLNSEVQLSLDFTVTGTTLPVEFDTIISDSTGLWDETIWSWVIVESQLLTITVLGKVTVVKNHPQNPPAEIRIMVNNVEAAILQFPINATNQDFFLTTAVGAVAGDEIRVDMFAQDRVGADDVITMHYLSDFSIASPDQVSRTVQPSQHIPKIGTRDFLKGILSYFNLMLITDDVTKTVFIYQFDELYTREAQDWSKLLDVGEDYEIFHAIKGYSQDSHFKYADDDQLVRTDADYIKHLDNEILNAESVVLQMPFGACDNSPATGEIEVPTVIVPDIFTESEHFDSAPDDAISLNGTTFIILDETAALEFSVGDFISLNNYSVVSRTIRRIVQKTSEYSGEVSLAFEETPGNYEAYTIYRHHGDNPVPRVALLKPTNQLDDSYSLTNGGWLVDPTPPDKVANPTNVANFSEVLLWENIVEEGVYEKLIDAIEAPQKLRAWFHLGTMIFNSTDFFRSVYISKFNAFYYINQITQFKPQAKTRVDLIRL